MWSGVSDAACHVAWAEAPDLLFAFSLNPSCLIYSIRFRPTFCLLLCLTLVSQAAPLP
jgi:hypothetical protein